MRAIALLAILLTTSNIYGKEDCSLESLKLNEKSNIAERLFYTGTCHYRNKDYDKSAKSWQQLAEMDAIDKDYKNLQVDVLNNLGYLMFFGLGMEKNQNKAITYWQKAITLGHYESEYHLCHAYADKKQPTFNREKAKKHCEKALLIYRGMEPRDKEILSYIESYYNDVK